MKEQLSQIAAKLRNVFFSGEFQKRSGDGKIQVLTHNGRVVEKKEAFPYGFFAKGESGRVFLFCQGGNLDGIEVFPVLTADEVTPPELDKWDCAVYTKSGVYIVLRDEDEIFIKTKKCDVKLAGGKITVNADDIDIKSKTPVGINDGLYGSGLSAYLTSESSAASALNTAASSASAQLGILDALSGGAGTITALGAAIVSFCSGLASADSAASTAIAKAVK
jgi:phage gp45-like